MHSADSGAEGDFKKNFLRTASSGLVLPFLRHKALCWKSSPTPNPHCVYVPWNRNGTICTDRIPILRFPYILEHNHRMDKNLVVPVWIIYRTR